MPEEPYARKSFMQSLSDGDREELLELGHRREWAQGDVLVRTGEPADSGIILLSGLAKIHKTADHGEEVVFAIAGAGDLFGEMSAIRERPPLGHGDRPHHVDAAVLPAPELRSFFSGHPGAVTALLDLTLTTALHGRHAATRVRRRRQPRQGSQPPRRARRAIR